MEKFNRSKGIIISHKDFVYFVTTYQGIKVNSIEEYFKGYKDFRNVYFGSLNKKHLYLTIRYLFLKQRGYKLEGASDNTIIKCKVDDSMVGQSLITGRQALRILLKVLPDYDKVFKSFTNDRDTAPNQLHYEYEDFEANEIHYYDNIYYYDINGAYCAILSELFPTVKKELEDLYYMKYKDPSYKQVYCFGVGMLKNEYPSAYWYIVQRIRKQITETIDSCCGILLEANTDGFRIADPEYPLETSKELGGWKLEYHGEAYGYRQKLFGYTPYYVLQYNGETVGTCPLELRHLIDLKNNEIVKYQKYRRYINYHQNIAILNDNWIIDYKNIEKEKL